MPIYRVSLLSTLVCGVLLAAPDEPKKPTPKFKPGKDTTYVDGPLDKEGYIDYETALNERLKGKTTTETNALVLLLKCIGPKPEGRELHADFYKALGLDAPPDKGAYLTPHNKFFAEELQGEDSQAFFALETKLRNQPWKPADSLKHAEWLELNEKPLELAVEASRRKDYFHPMISRTQEGKRGMLLEAALPTVQRCREFASLLSLRATLRLGQGKTEDAFADALAMHRLGHLVSRGATLIELLVGIAIDQTAHSTDLAILEFGKPTAKQALAYRDALQQLAPMATVAEKVELGERFLFLDAVQSSRQHGFDLVEMRKAKNQEEIDIQVEFLDWEAILRLGNTWYDRMANAQRKTTRAERIAAYAEYDKEMQRWNAEVKETGPLKRLMRKGAPAEVRAKVSEQVGKVYIGLMIPGIQRLNDSTDRCEQIHRNGVIAAALAAHFADEMKYPTQLADLVPKYLAKVPGDVFNDKPLIYKKTDTGYLFYSVGVNGKDDGGQLLTDEPRGDDIGVRMPRR